MEENAPPSLRSNSCIWSLIVGSEASSWAGLLLYEHLGHAAWMALFRTCKASRDMLLSTAEHVSATLALVAGDPAHEFKRMRALRPFFKSRGMQTTLVNFKLGCVELWPLTQALAVLEEGGQCLQEMEVEYPAGTLPVSIMTEIGRCYPNLKYLGILSELEAMPSPELFPRLQELHICPVGMEAANLEQLYLTTQPYLPRLTWLAVGHMLEQPPSNMPAPLSHPPLLFGPGPLPGLRSLELATTLNDDLLGLLLHCAPSLQTLTVVHVLIQSDMHAHTACAWQDLTCTGNMHLSSLARLPLPEGVVVKALKFICDVTNNEDQAALQAAMPKVTLRMAIRTGDGRRGVWLKPKLQLQPDLQPTALRVCLKLLCTRLDEGDYPPSHMRLGLGGWTLSGRLIHELQGLPHWDALRLGASRVAGHSCMPTTLLRSLPSSFSTVVLPVDTPNIEAICWGAPMDRTAERPFHIKLYGDAGRVQAVMTALQLSEAFPNVIVAPY